MSFKDDLRAHLLADATITGIVGERIYAIIRQQGSPLPALTYQIIFDGPQTSLDGFTSGLSSVRVQIDAWALAYDVAYAIGQAVRDRMYVNAATFKVSKSDASDLYEDVERIYRRTQDFSVWFNE